MRIGHVVTRAEATEGGPSGGRQALQPIHDAETDLALIVEADRGCLSPFSAL